MHSWPFSFWAIALVKEMERGSDQTANILTADYRDLKASITYIDATGIGSGVAPNMRRSKCTAVGIKVAERPTVECEFA